MKRKIIYFLFILCSGMLLIGNVYAEGENPNNGDACKVYRDDNVRLECCNQADEAYKQSCKAPVIKKCTSKEKITDRLACCETFNDKIDRDNCMVESYSACSNADIVELSKVASNVKIVYEPYEYKPDGFDDENSPNYSVIYYMMDIKIYNVTSDISIGVVGEDGGYTVDMKNMNSDGVIVLRSKDTKTIKNYTFNVYSKSANCSNKILRTIKLTVPKYNQYSSRSACDDIPQYYLCHQFINFDVDASNFISNIENYKEKLKKKQIVDNNKKDDKTSVATQKILKSVSDNKFTIIGGILVIGVVITVLILRRRNS